MEREEVVTGAGKGQIIVLVDLMSEARGKTAEIVCNGLRRQKLLSLLLAEKAAQGADESKEIGERRITCRALRICTGAFRDHTCWPGGRQRGTEETPRASAPLP